MELKTAKKIEKAVIQLKEAHKTKDVHMLNYASDILDSFNHLKDFSDVLKHYALLHGL